MREPLRPVAGARWAAVLLPPLPEDGENPLAWIDDDEITNDETECGS